MDAVADARGGADRLCAAGTLRRRRGADHRAGRHGRIAGGAVSFVRRRRARARRRADPGRRRGRRSGSGTTARGRCTAGSASPPPMRASFALYNTLGRGGRAGRRGPREPAILRGRVSGDADGKLYQEIILDHYRAPAPLRLRDPFDAEVHHVNPTCGDEVTLRVRSTADGDLRDAVVQDISYEALGCSISQASTSVLTDLAIGRPLGEAMSSPGRRSPRWYRSRCGRAGDEDVLGDGGGIRRRVQVPGPGEMRPAGVDGVQGRGGAGRAASRPTAPASDARPMTETTSRAAPSDDDATIGELGPQAPRRAGRDAAAGRAAVVDPASRSIPADRGHRGGAQGRGGPRARHQHRRSRAGLRPARRRRATSPPST